MASPAFFSRQTVFDLQFAQACSWPTCFLPSESRGICVHCAVATYERNGLLFHVDGYRACHWSTVTVAEVA